MHVLQEPSIGSPFSEARAADIPMYRDGEGAGNYVARCPPAQLHRSASGMTEDEIPGDFSRMTRDAIRMVQVARSSISKSEPLVNEPRDGSDRRQNPDE